MTRWGSDANSRAIRLLHAAWALAGHPVSVSHPSWSAWIYGSVSRRSGKRCDQQTIRRDACTALQDKRSVVFATINGSLRSLIETGKGCPNRREKKNRKRFLNDDGLGSVRRRLRPCRRPLPGVPRNRVHATAEPASLLCSHDGFGDGRRGRGTGGLDRGLSEAGSV